MCTIKWNDMSAWWQIQLNPPDKKRMNSSAKGKEFIFDKNWWRRFVQASIFLGCRAIFRKLLSFVLFFCVSQVNIQRLFTPYPFIDYVRIHRYPHDNALFIVFNMKIRFFWTQQDLPHKNNPRIGEKRLQRGKIWISTGPSFADAGVKSEEKIESGANSLCGIGRSFHGFPRFFSTFHAFLEFPCFSNDSSFIALYARHKHKFTQYIVFIMQFKLERSCANRA